MGAQLRVKQVEGFARRQNHDLHKMLREMSKEAPDVLKKLLTLMESKDEEIQFKAVKLFMDYHREIAKDINTDQMTRLLATYKYNAPGNLVDEDDGPDVNFDLIQDA